MGGGHMGFGSSYRLRLFGGYATTAREAIEYGMTCPAAIGNPFMHLRFGQILYDSSETDHGADALIRAYMGAGPEIFAPENPNTFHS
jgi:hypothetical protein